MKNFLSSLLFCLPFLFAGSAQGALSIQPTILYTFDGEDAKTDSMGTMNLNGYGTTVAGLFGSAASAAPGAGQFRGPTDTANPGTYSPYTQPGTGDFSLSFWYRTDETNPGDFSHLLFQGGLWNGGPNQTAGYTFQLNKSGTISLHTGDIDSDGVRTSIHSTAAVLKEEWNHIAMVREGDTMTLYLNGDSYSAALASGYNIAVNNGNGEWYREFTIGPSPSGSGGMAGSAIDDVGIWKGGALTAADISQIYNGGTGASITSLIIPEPSLAALAGMGVLALAGFRRRR